MKNALHARESVRAGLLRVARAQVRRALRLSATPAAPGGDRAAAVHEVRITLKRLRAWWRLLRPLAGEAAYRRENARLRRAAAGLALQRDAVIALEALDELAKGAKDHPRQRRALTAVRGELATQEMRQVADRHTQAALRRAGAAMQASLRALAGLRLEHQGWQALEPGLRRAYRRVCRAFQGVTPAAPDGAFHQWRKRLKDLNYQVELIAPALDKGAAARARRLKQLASLLGDDHDLVIVRGLVVGPASATAAPGRAAGAAKLPAPTGNCTPDHRTVARLASLRSRELRERCQKLGTRLLREKPGEFLRRMSRHWREWRK